MAYRLLLLSDHKTLTSTRGHDGSPVPFLLYDSRADSAAGVPFDEASGEKGAYVQDGYTLLGRLFEQAHCTTP